MKAKLPALMAALLSLILLTYTARAQYLHKAPGIALEDTNGNFILLSGLLSESNVIISFWSYDCLPCLKEMPELQKMGDSGLLKRKNIRLVFICVETSSGKAAESSDKSSKQKALEVLKKLEIKEMCLFDIYGIAYNKYIETCGIATKSMPVLFLVNRKKDIVFYSIGYDGKNLKKLEDALEKDLQ